MKYIKYFKMFENLLIFPKLYYQILSSIGYYDAEEREDKKFKYNIFNFEKLKIIGEKLYDKNKNIFPNSKVNNMDYYTNPDNSNKLVSHSTDINFDVFKTPAFFGATEGYKWDDSITYYCLLDIKNPLDLRSSIFHNNKKEWFKLLEEIFKDDKDCQRRLDFAQEYEDGYGFFKLLFNVDDNWGAYRWDLIYDYINKNGYDGAIYRESDSSIQYYFDGFLVMNPDQIKIIFKWDDEKKDFYKK